MTLATVATSALVPAATPAAAQSVAPVTLYRDINYLGYSGPSITLAANTPDLKLVGFNDMASSLTVPPGTKVALFEHANYLGACTAFTANDPDLSNNPVNLNDRVSSVRFGQDCPLQLYDSAGYNGPYRLFWSDVPNLAQYTFNDTVASLRVPPGTKVATYSDINYGGICEEFTADDPDLYGNASGTARISSVKFGASCPPQVVFFEHLNYEGAFIKFDSSYMETLSLQSVGWSDRVSSVYLAGGDHSVHLWYEEYVCKRISLQYQICNWETVGSWFSVSTPDTRSSKVGEDRADYASIGRLVVW
jgi:hypothetical protein